MKGKLYGIGIGPGDPELLTLKAIRVLQGVDVVAVPKSREDRESVALSIARPHLNRDDIKYMVSEIKNAIKQEG